MSRKILFLKIVVGGLAAVFILSSCNGAAPSTPTATVAATETQVASSPTFTLLPSLTSTATLVPSETPTITATEPPTPTAQLTPQVNPGMNAYCRKGPGTGYYPITFLQVGTNYTVLGQNGLNTWYLIEAPGNVTCWMGDPTSVFLGPIWDVPILSFPPLPRQPVAFAGDITCQASLNNIAVNLTWDSQNDANGFHLYLNDKLAADLGPRSDGYQVNLALFGVKLTYTLEAYNDYGVSFRASVTFQACGA